MVDAIYNRRKSVYKKLKSQTFQQNWAFKLYVPDSGIDFDLFVKDISYGATEIESEPKQIGGGIYTEPQSAAPVVLAVTVRDNENGDFATWFDEQAGKIFNSDGTKNLPPDFLFDIELYTIKADNEELLRHSWEVFASLRGDRTESVDELGAYVSYPVSFQQYFSLG